MDRRHLPPQQPSRKAIKTAWSMRNFEKEFFDRLEDDLGASPTQDSAAEAVPDPPPPGEMEQPDVAT